MYSVLLVDDEGLITDGLKKLINWEKLGLYVRDTALNGEEALQKFKQNPVDIVITDITMPKLDGIGLIENIKSINDKVKFVILSGYDDFEYARQALRLGIENYILKPINEEELESTLINTKKKLDNAEDNIVDVKELEILRENILYRWVANSISSYELEERKFILRISLDCMFYVVSIIKLNEDSRDNDNLRKVYEHVKSFEKNYKDFAVFNDLDGNIVIIYASNEKKALEQKLYSYLKNIVENISDKFSLDYFVTIGNIEKSFNDVYKSYNTALKMQDYLLINGYNKVVTYKDYEQEYNIKNNELNIDLSKIRAVILNKNKEEGKRYIDEMYDKLCSYEYVTPETLQNTSIQIMMNINKIASELNVENKKYNKNLKKLVLDISNIQTIEQLKTRIKEEILEVIDKLKANSGDMSPVIRQVLKYINENYDEDISLKYLSEKYNINPSYLGQVFNKEVGESFSYYLNKVRNEKAKKLLLTTNIKVKDIAKMLGYEDTSYFYRKFKKYFGVSPNTLRGSKNY